MTRDGSNRHEINEVDFESPAKEISALVDTLGTKHIWILLVSGDNDKICQEIAVSGYMPRGVHAASDAFVYETIFFFDWNLACAKRRRGEHFVVFWRTCSNPV